MYFVMHSMDFVLIEVVIATQVIITVNDFAECLNKGGQCDVLALDFSKLKLSIKYQMPVYITNCLTME